MGVLFGVSSFPSEIPGNERWRPEFSCKEERNMYQIAVNCLKYPSNSKQRGLTFNERLSFELFDTNGFNGGLQNVHIHTVLIIVHVHVSTLYVGLNSLFFKLISNTQFFKSDFYLKYII